MSLTLGITILFDNFLNCDLFAYWFGEQRHYSAGVQEENFVVPVTKPLFRALERRGIPVFASCCREVQASPKERRLRNKQRSRRSLLLDASSVPRRKQIPDRSRKLCLPRS